MSKTDDYHRRLSSLADWDSFLLIESGLPGPRANLELAQAVADLGDIRLFKRYLSYQADRAPTNSPYVFLVVCGVIGLGRLVSEGEKGYLKTLRVYASDPRWRIREGVAMALQRVGDKDLGLLLREMARWSQGNLLERRAAAAALCEPRLLREAKHTRKVLEILDQITASILTVEDRKSDEFKTLRQGLAYCWSVAVAALPNEGKKRMEKWFLHKDADVRWIMVENLKKDRLARIDRAWVLKWKARLAK